MATARKLPALKSPIQAVGTLKDIILAASPQLREVAANEMTPERLTRMAAMAVNKTPALLRCTGESVLASLMKASQLGLDCSGTLGSAYMVPYGNKCELIIGYQGMIDLMRRSGELEDIKANLVYDADTFEIDLGNFDQPVIHHPVLDAPRRADDIIVVYGIAWLKGNTRPHFDYMTRGEVDDIMGRSKASGSGPWRTDYGEMAKKTMIRRMAKQLPKSVELARNMETVDNEFEGRTVSVQSGGRPTDRVNRMIGVGDTPVVEPVDEDPFPPGDVLDVPLEPDAADMANEPPSTPSETRQADDGPTDEQMWYDNTLSDIRKASKCTKALAVTCLSDFCRKVYRADPQSLDAEQRKSVTGNVNMGNIRPKAPKEAAAV
jgi:recombination protein RecT